MSRDLVKEKINNGVPVRLEYVDSIRGLAALSVVVAHFIVPLYANSSFIFHYLFDFGKIGVVLFFIISGFIIPFSFKIHNGGVKAFLISRFFRLYPAYWFSLFVFLLFSCFLGKYFPTYQIFANITMFQTAVGVKDIVGVYWTLFIELIFYSLCIVLFVVGILNKVKTNFSISLFMLFIALVLGVTRYFSGISFPVALPLALSLMMFGGMWRAFVLHEDLFAKKMCFNYMAIYVLMIPVICNFAYGGISGYGVRYVVTYYISMLLFVLFTTKIRLTNSYLAYLGTISYSMYLIHPSILILFEGLSLGLSSNMTLLLAIIGVLITIPVSHVIFKIIEEPSINFGRRVKRLLVRG
ncbi:acyltransferase [Serratia proteamaculans]|uniref:Acyltransferase n=1 Tax=Serratia proteamaculans TaxID=28151 RepID=A0ABS0U288_SERPR|nr:acyltransferase [Serratia proteamaculans]MBI6183620.1 acyltransferase [Serratia proteamaculans]